MKSIRWFTLLALTVVAPRALHADRVVSTNTTQDGGTFVVDPAGALTISDSTNDPLLTLTNGATTTGIMSVIVGNQSGEQGQVQIESGSTLINSGRTSLGIKEGSIGTITITGSGSTWQNDGNFSIGPAGTGVLNVENGGALTSSASFLGTTTNSNGTATITGEDSVWNNEFIGLGSFGTGILNVQNGGSVYTNGDAFFGIFDGGHGTATISGTGSKWQITEWLNIGAPGTGALTIEYGGHVTSGKCELNDGTVTVTGPGSAWQNSRDLWIYKRGVLNVNNSGVVEVSRFLDNSGTIIGNNGTIIANIYNRSGLISPGDSPNNSVGTLKIGGNLASSGFIKFELAGAESGLFDQLIVTGDLSLFGVVEIDLLDGFTPTAHSEFKLIDASNFNGPGGIFLPVTFDFTHAALDSGLSWDTSTFAVDGTIRVVPETSSLVLAGVGAMAGFIGWRTKSRSQ